MATKTVIDVSKFNTITNWSSVADRVDGVIIRIGYRAYASGNITKDTSFDSHVKGAVGAGIPIGMYFFSQAINASEGKAEADYCIDIAKNYSLSMPIFVDSEYSNNNHNGRADSLSKSARTTAIKAFCEEIVANGYPAGVYAADDWYKNQLNLSELTSYNLWVARYSSNSPANVSNYVGWQYTSKNTMTGISGNIDTSHWYGDITTVSVATEAVASSSSNTTSSYSAGDKVELNKVSLYGTASTSKVAATRTGTYYIWSNITNNGRIRITNKASNAGVSGQITGWVNLSDLGPTSSSSSSSSSSTSSSSISSTTSLKTGAKVTLSSVNIYATSSTSKVAATKSGTYYVWASSVVNNRIRITNSSTNVGKSGSVTGWVDVADIS